MGDRSAGVSVTDEVERNLTTHLLVDRALPGIVVTPPLKLVPLAALTTTAVHIHAGIVAELKLDGVGGSGLLCLAFGSQRCARRVAVMAELIVAVGRIAGVGSAGADRCSTGCRCATKRGLRLGRSTEGLDGG